MNNYYWMGSLVLCILTFVIKPAYAHVGYVSLTNGVTLNNSGFNNYGWLNGASPWLGDSHMLEGAVFYTFHLDQAEYVTISFASASKYFDPAFTLYSGKLPDQGHDDAAVDPLGSGGLAISPSDAAPNDPGIAHFLWNQNTLSFSYNPQWNQRLSNLCDTANGCNLTPAQWYADNYTPHNGYRDILNYTATGGLNGNGNPIHAYQGQFDALGNWSMANENGDWSQINYIAYANNNVTNLGANGLPLSGYNTQTEILSNVLLQAGDYTIAAGGAGCLYTPGQSAPLTCTASSMNGALTFTASMTPSNPVAVPIPPLANWIIGAMLAFLGTIIRTRQPWALKRH